MLAKSLLMVASLMALLGAPPAWSADVPMLLNYQGNLSDPAGVPRNGSFAMQFAVYDAETGGNQLPSASPWSETQSVTVSNGVFNVLLGSLTALPTDLFQGGPMDASGPLRFLQVTVDGEALSPRRRLASAAYAIGASSAHYANGVTIRGGTAASGTQTIAHGLSRRPLRVRIFAVKQSGGFLNGMSYLAMAQGTFDSSGTSSVQMNMNSSGGGGSSSSTANIVEIIDTGGSQAATCAVDGTNITLSWTKSDGPPGPTAGNIQIHWSAEY